MLLVFFSVLKKIYLCLTGICFSFITTLCFCSSFLLTVGDLQESPDSDLLISLLPRQVAGKFDENMEQKHTKSDKIHSNYDKQSFVVSDTLNYYATFGPPFVSVKVFQPISVSNLFLTLKKACMHGLLVSVCKPPLYKGGAGRTQALHCKTRQRKV